MTDTACIGKNYSGKYTKKDKPRYGLCHSRPDMINTDDIIEDETVINKLLKNNSNAPSAAKAPAPRSAAAIASAATRLSHSKFNPETITKINILIEYLRFLCKTLTHHRRTIAGITDKDEFIQAKNKKNKITLYSYLIRSLDDLNKIIDDIDNKRPPDMDISTIISSGRNKSGRNKSGRNKSGRNKSGGTRKKQKIQKITMQKSRKATRKKATVRKHTVRKHIVRKSHVKNIN